MTIDLCWSVALYDLGLAEETFWRLTPYEFGLLVERHRGDNRWREMMSAMAPWVFAETHRDSKSRPYRLRDFMVSELGRSNKSETTKQDALWEKVGGVMNALRS